MKASGVILLEINAGTVSVPLMWTVDGGGLSLSVADFHLKVNLSEDGSIAASKGETRLLNLSSFQVQKENARQSEIICDPRLIPEMFKIVRDHGEMTRDEYFATIEEKLGVEPGSIAANSDVAEEAIDLIESIKRSLRQNVDA